MRPVNLLPDGGRSGRRPFGNSKAPAIAIGAVALVGGLGYWGWSIHSESARLDESIAVATAERDQLDAQLGAYRAARERYAAQDVKRGTVVSLTAGRVNWERVIRGVAAVVPSTVWLDTVRAEAPDATAAAAAAAPGGQLTTPKGLHVEGYAYTQPQVAQLISRMRVVPGLGPAQLTTSEVERRGGRKVVRFVIDAPIDKRAQDRATLEPVQGAGAADPAAGAPAASPEGETL
jgi:Tfp pilus assembly protein PilN